MKLKFHVSLIFKRSKFLLRVLNLRHLFTSIYFFRLDGSGRKVRARLFDISIIYQNEFYGIGNVLRKTSNRAKLDDVYIEHGFYLYSLPDQYIWPVDRYICMSSARAATVSRESGRRALSIGPYVHYAHEQCEFHPSGDYVLYIPMHEIGSIMLEYDEKLVMDSVLEVAKNFGYKPVVCLYYKDFENVTVKDLWQRRGFNAVTCGSRYDQDHLSKVKSIIGNARLMISNGFGTHYIYALYLNIPTQVIDVKVTKRFSKGTEFIGKLRTNKGDNISPASKVSVDALAVKRFEEIVNDTALARAEKADYFGFNDIKTEQEISFFLQGK